MIETILVVFGAYLTVLIQIGFLGAWPLIGGQPHLIALWSIIFPILHRPMLGFWWILIGSSLIDLLSPARFGSTLLPLMIAYIAVAYVTRRVTETPSWWMSVGFSLLLLLASELPLVFYTGSWHQLVLDLGAATIIMVPICTIFSSTRSSNQKKHVYF
jgi:hypothetical protein